MRSRLCRVELWALISLILAGGVVAVGGANDPDAQLYNLQVYPLKNLGNFPIPALNARLEGLMNSLDNPLYLVDDVMIEESDGKAYSGIISLAPRGDTESDPTANNVYDFVRVPVKDPNDPTSTRKLYSIKFAAPGEEWQIPYFENFNLPNSILVGKSETLLEKMGPVETAVIQLFEESGSGFGNPTMTFYNQNDYDYFACINPLTPDVRWNIDLIKRAEWQSGNDARVTGGEAATCAPIAFTLLPAPPKASTQMLTQQQAEMMTSPYQGTKLEKIVSADRQSILSTPQQGEVSTNAPPGSRVDFGTPDSPKGINNPYDPYFSGDQSVLPRPQKLGSQRNLNDIFFKFDDETSKPEDLLSSPLLPQNQYPYANDGGEEPNAINMVNNFDILSSASEKSSPGMSGSQPSQMGVVDDLVASQNPSNNAVTEVLVAPDVEDEGGEDTAVADLQQNQSNSGPQPGLQRMIRRMFRS